MEILKKTGKFLLGVVIGVAIMMFADRYYVKGKRLIADNLPKEPVEYVNPYMGNISHLLVPTYPTVHLPNSMLRVYPERGDFTGDRLGGLPLIVTSHRGSSAFNLKMCIRDSDCRLDHPSAITLDGRSGTGCRDRWRYQGCLLYTSCNGTDCFNRNYRLLLCEVKEQFVY